jgi:GntR family transcriptional regulator
MVGPTDCKGQVMPIPPTMDELIEDLLRRIKQREFMPGTRIPAGHELADQYGVSLSTIQRAVAILRERGILVGRPGRGVYVAEG